MHRLYRLHDDPSDKGAARAGTRQKIEMPLETNGIMQFSNVRRRLSIMRVMRAVRSFAVSSWHCRAFVVFPS